jgi:hypothetical protein
LVNYGKFEIDDNHYLIGRNATRKNILRAVSEVFRKDNKCDLVTFYFSGHGIVDEENNEGYLAPYDMDPEFPLVSGINMKDLKKVILYSNNNAGVIFILDCCYAGIVTKDTKVMAPPEQKTRNLYADHLHNIIKSDTEVIASDMDLVGTGKIVLASIEATAVSREKNNCIHGVNDSPHSHGVFSYHLIEGLDGKAADPDTGIITINNLRKYIEQQMEYETRQKIMYYIVNASNVENIKIAVSQNKFEEKIKKLIIEAYDLLKRRDLISNRVHLYDLLDAAIKVNELVNLDSRNKEISRFIGLINEELDKYKEPAIEWMNNNMRVARHKVNEIRNFLYESELFDIIYSLSFKTLVNMSNSYINALVYLFAEVEQNTIFSSPEDRKLKLLVLKLRAIFDQPTKTL